MVAAVKRPIPPADSCVATLTNRSDTTSGTTVMRMPFTHIAPIGSRMPATRSAIGPPRAPIALPKIKPAMRPMTTRWARIGRENYRFLPDLLRAVTRVAVRVVARLAGRCALAAGFLAEAFWATALVRVGWARFAPTRTLADAFLAGAALLGVALAVAFLAAGLVGAGAAATALALAAAAAAAGVTGFVRGRPPLRANCASANILANASFASAMSWACEIRRSWRARAFSSR